MSKIFITGIGTEVGKTVCSAIITEALGADYWKPIQAGDLDNSDTDKVKSWVTNKTCYFHPNTFALKTPMSPHAAAEIDNIEIKAFDIIPPKTENNLVIEGAGGLLVPINNHETILDLIHENYKTIVISKHYLGSINHTLLTINTLKSKNISISGILYNGEEHPTTEAIISKMSGVPIIGRINQLSEITPETVKKEADNIKDSLLNALNL